MRQIMIISGFCDENIPFVIGLDYDPEHDYNNEVIQHRTFDYLYYHLGKKGVIIEDVEIIKKEIINFTC